MTIDINELRRKLQSDDFIDRIDIHANVKPVLTELLDRLEAAEKSDAESIAMYRKARDERDALRLAVRHEADCVDAAKAEIEALRAKIEQMEKQEPVAYLPLSSARILESGFIANAVVWNCRDKAASDMPLYALPGAQPAPSFADAYQGAMEEAAIWKKRALEAEDLNRKFIAEINGPTHMGEPAPSVLEDWPTEEMTTAFANVFNVRNQSGTFTPAFRAALAAAPKLEGE